MYTQAITLYGQPTYPYFSASGSLAGYTMWAVMNLDGVAYGGGASRVQTARATYKSCNGRHSLAHASGRWRGV